MKNQSLNRLAPCLVAALVALANGSANGEETVIYDSGAPDGGSYVGDMPCSNCGNQGSGGFGSGNGRDGLFANHRRPVDYSVHPRAYGQPDLFYNYYTQGFANRANAQMYISPVPVPPNVGHTFNTYQPFLPQHHLYPHVDKYHRYYDHGRGMNRTKASYWTSAHSRVKNFYWNFLRLPR